MAVSAERATLQALLCQWHKTLQKDGIAAVETFVKLPLLFMPFVPFVVVFGHQLATGDESDLQLMRDIVDIVTTAAKINGGMNKMHLAFFRLLQIAEAQKSRNGRAQAIVANNPSDSRQSNSQSSSLHITC